MTGDAKEFVMRNGTGATFAGIGVRELALSCHFWDPGITAANF